MCVGSLLEHWEANKDCAQVCYRGVVKGCGNDKVVYVPLLALFKS